MRRFIEIIRNLFSGKNGDQRNQINLDTDSVIQLIKKIEETHKSEPGRRIHSFEYLDFELSLDLEVTGQYRLVANLGKEKRYSFSIKCTSGNYEVLKEGINQAAKFLAGERKIAQLPDNEIIKGRFFGN